MAHGGVEVLSDQMIYKLQQIIDFCESFAMDEQKQVEHFTLQESKLLAKQRLEEQVLRQARERVRAESGDGEVSYVRKSMLAQQKQENRQRQLLEMKFADEEAIESGGPAAGGVSRDTSQERPQEQS